MTAEKPAPKPKPARIPPACLYRPFQPLSPGPRPPDRRPAGPRARAMTAQPEPQPETTCEVCEHYAPKRHPCRFERACSCWYGVPCHGTGARYRAPKPNPKPRP